MTSKQTEQVPSKSFLPANATRQQTASPSPNVFVDLQKRMGNQALLQLLSAGVIQPKLRVSQPGDPDEQEADHVADKIVASTHGLKIHRKCACESTGAPCQKCEDEETTIHRSGASTSLHASTLAIQRAPAGPDPAAAADKNSGTSSKPSPTPSKTHPLVVEDDAQSVAPHQMRKSAFIALLRADACAAADAVLASVGRTTKSCPYIAKWLPFFENQSSAHVERAMIKYSPATAGARSAHEAIHILVTRIQEAALTWAKTGRIPGIPVELAGQLPGPRPVADGKQQKTPGAASTSPSASTLSRKSADGGATPAHDAGSVRRQLGTGHSLDSRVQSQMSAAFGHDFSGVRVHTDSRATTLSSDLNARAFTIGTDVAFASGEYQPGTLVGDALIAHELAHVMQQREASTDSLQEKGDDNVGAWEEDADVSAVSAVASIWGGARRGFANIGRAAIPALKSGLRLQRCSQKVKRCPKGYSWRVQSATGMGSFGSLCHWKCMPGEPPGAGAYSDESAVRCPPDMNCDTGVRIEELDDSYTKTGYGATFTPLGEQPYTGCFPLDEEGRKIRDIPLRPTDFEMTDVAAPLADMATAAKNKARARTDPTTGKPLPDKEAPSTTSPTRAQTEVRGTLGADVEVGNLRVGEYRNTFDAGKNRNVAFADYDVAGQKGTLVAISGKAEREGTVSPPSAPQLPTLVVGHDRSFDSEKKILEQFTTQLGDNPGATGTINLFSERTVCASCSVAISEFRARYPHITLNVVSGGK
jgi:Domain of unknown function (DUF4157)/The  BURPS668_1122 family of deaminases